VSGDACTDDRTLSLYYFHLPRAECCVMNAGYRRPIFSEVYNRCELAVHLLA
jgi:hypothetical protein